MPSKGKRKSKAGPSAPLKRQEPPPPCPRDCNCLGCLDARSDTSMDTTMTTEQAPQPPSPAPDFGEGWYEVMFAAGIFGKWGPPPEFNVDEYHAFRYHMAAILDLYIKGLGEDIHGYDGYEKLPRVSRFRESLGESVLAHQEKLDHGRILLPTTPSLPPIPTSHRGSQTEPPEPSPGPSPPPLMADMGSQTPTRFFRETKLVDTEVQTESNPPPAPPAPPPPQTQTPLRFYKEVGTEGTPPRKKQTPPNPPPPGKKPSPPPAPPPPAEKSSAPPPPPPPRSASPTQTRAVVLHAAPTKYKAGQMRRWVEEDNKGIEIAGIRWLLQEGRRLGKAASSLVIYLATPLEPGHLRMGRKLFRTTEYNWDRPTLAKEQGRA